MDLPKDYEEKVYAGLLGKTIGVYIGRPIEGWPYEKINKEIGQVDYYINEKLGKPLIVTDDDISGTLTFLRTLEDYNFPKELKPEMVGQSWLNYLVQNRSVIAWNGVGNLPAPTAYYNLKKGIKPPESGSAELNTKELSEQDGSQIFVDGWAMVSPGDPEKAADFAQKASCVAFDGEAIYGAQCWAAIEAEAFITKDIERLLDVGLSFIPRNCEISKMIRDIREYFDKEKDWLKCWYWFKEKYGYQHYPGSCPIVPNHGIIIFSLLYGESVFHRSMMIVNSVGWDTDCNAGNLGCLLGIMNGLEGIDSGPDWRNPVSDRIFNSVADGGQCITDVLTEAYKIINYGRRLKGLKKIEPKDGARYHFEMPGSLQGWRLDKSEECRDLLTIKNVEGWSKSGKRSLALNYHKLAKGRVARVFSDVFIPDDCKDYLLSDEANYPLDASPAIYEGQTIGIRVVGDNNNKDDVNVAVFINTYNEYDETVRYYSDPKKVEPGKETVFEWEIKEINNRPIYSVGIEISHNSHYSSNSGTVYLDYFKWEGEPDTSFKKPVRKYNDCSGYKNPGIMWFYMWVNACDFRRFPDLAGKDPIIMTQNEDRGHMTIGTKSWKNYIVTANIDIKHAKAAGVAARMQGLSRYYALLLYSNGKIKLTRTIDKDKILGEANFEFTANKSYKLSLRVKGSKLWAFLDDKKVFDIDDKSNNVLATGGIALICEEGTIFIDEVKIAPNKD